VPPVDIFEVFVRQSPDGIDDSGPAFLTVLPGSLSKVGKNAWKLFWSATGVPSWKRDCLLTDQQALTLSLGGSLGTEHGRVSILMQPNMGKMFVHFVTQLVYGEDKAA
jgi:hypothetical protein